MPFVKLDCGILNSTLWVERECREIFITSLLMAEPFELRAPEPQIEVRTLSLTGWVVPVGWYGLVPAAGVGIVHRAGVSNSDAGLAALERLGSVDLESRSKDFDGRRLVRIDGGYLVLNFFKYRDRDYTGAARAARYRMRKKEAAVTRDVSSSHRDITQAEAEAEIQSTLRPTVASGNPAGSHSDSARKVNGYHPPPCPTAAIIEAYHELLPAAPRVLLKSKVRESHISARWREICSDEKLDTAGGMRTVREYLSIAARSKFLTGRTSSKDRKPFVADLGWLMKAENFVKVGEGKYE